MKFKKKYCVIFGYLLCRPTCFNIFVWMRIYLKGILRDNFHCFILHGSCTLMAKRGIFSDFKWELTDGTDGHDMGAVKNRWKGENKRVMPLKALSSLHWEFIVKDFWQFFLLIKMTNMKFFFQLFWLWTWVEIISIKACMSGKDGMLFRIASRNELKFLTCQMEFSF